MGRGFFHRPVSFGFCYCLLVILQVSVGLYIAGVLTTLERQYRITSAVAGLILSTSDFASLVSIIGVTYVGQKWHRPRIVGLCGLLTGIGGILSGLPHFLYPAYRDADSVNTGTSNITSSIFMCDVDRKPVTCSADDISDSGSRLHEAWALFIGQALMGLAYGPMLPIAVSYLDDQVKGTTTPYYIAAFLASGTSATIIGFGEGFAALTINVNWPAPTDPAKEWIGAWWLGFLIDGVIIIFLSIPFFFFPKEMDVEIDEKDISKERLALEKQRGESGTTLGVRDFLAAVKRLSTNFVYLMLLFGSIFDLAVSASFGFFLPKFMETQFDISPSFTALLVGIIIMPAALIGNVSSGFIVKKLNLTSRGLGRLIVFLTLVVMCFIPGVYFLSCPEIKYAGYEDGVLSIDRECNSGCDCTIERFAPVCGANDQVYTTPCYAGCTGERQNQTADPNVNITVYTGCNCSVTDGDVFGAAGEAVSGKCTTNCDMFYYASILFFGIVTFGSIAQNPLFVMQIRAAGNDKTFALGVTALFGRALGFLPAPLYFGAFLQGACVLSRMECGVSGDCLVYNSQQFRLTFLAVFFGLKIFNLIFYTLATTLATINQNKLDREETDKENDIKDIVELNEIEDGADNNGYISTGEAGTQTDITVL